MVDLTQLLGPDFPERLSAALGSGANPYAFAVDANRLREVIRSGPGSEQLKDQLLAFLEIGVIQGRSTVSCVLLGMAVAQFANKTDDQDVVLIAHELRDLDKLPYVVVNGKNVC